MSRTLYGQAIRAMAALLIGLTLTYSAGCSFFGSSSQTLSVTSDPEGADVEVNGSYIGQTPLQYQIPTKRSSMIVVRKEGYRTVNRTTSTKLSTLGILDIVGTFFFLVPILGLIAPGAYEQEGANLSVNLPKKTE